MIQKTGICLNCNKDKPINSKGLCPDCQYHKTHGISRFEAHKSKEQSKERKIYSLKRKPLKTSYIKLDRLEKRRAIVNKDEELYEYIFNTKENKCEECGTWLPNTFRDENNQVIMRSQYSHILTKGAHALLRHHKKNINRLCDSCHDTWEFGDREKMKIYKPNQITINELLKELRNE